MTEPTSEQVIPAPRAKRRRWRVLAITTLLALASTVGFTAVADSFDFRVRGGNGNNGALLRCPGGMERLAHPFAEGFTTVFPGDPEVETGFAATIEEDGFRVETIFTGTHGGTHLDVPAHFYADGRSVDELHATEFVWPAYVIDVRDRVEEEGPDFMLEKADIREVEREYGRIKEGSMVIIFTGHQELYGNSAYTDTSHPGFSAEAVQWMFDKRWIAGAGSDGLGPDASIDGTFGATATALDPANDGVALPGLNNLDRLNVKGDIIIASALPLVDGSGFITDPLACRGNGW